MTQTWLKPVHVILGLSLFVANADASLLSHESTMLMRTVLQNRESVILEPIQEPTIGWYIRPGTVRVAQPYDSNAHNIHAGDSQDVRTLSDTHSSPETSEPSHKRQKRSKTKAGNSSDLDQELIQWIKTEFLSIIEHDSSRLWIRDMLGDYFYGTFVDAPASNTFALDLIKLQPTLQMLKSGFTPTGNRDALKDQEILSFDRLELENGSQQLDLDDFYEVLVMNGHSEPALVTFATEGRPRYLMPPRSGFVVSDLNAVHGLKGVARQLGGFDIVVMDPPWQNASVDRMGHYDTMDMYDLFKIPIADLLRDNNNGGIVAVWITNRAKVKKVVVEKLFPAWGLQLVAHWIWLKVTTHGEPVLSLDNMHRKPYEGILIGRQRSTSKESSANEEVPPTIPIVKRKLIVSVPAQHSRKPSIHALLEESFFPQNPAASETEISTHPNTTARTAKRCEKPTLNKLELFARNLEENVISWGNEPIRHQYCGRESDGGIVEDGYLVPGPPLTITE